MRKRSVFKSLAYLLVVAMVVLSMAGCGNQEVTGEMEEFKTLEDSSTSEEMTSEAEEKNTEEVADSTEAEDSGQVAASATESSQAAQEAEPFVPENPDMIQLEEGQVQLDLESRMSVFGQGIGQDDGKGGVIFGDGTVNKCMFPLPSAVAQGGTVKVTMKGSFGSTEDIAVRVYLTNQTYDNCTEALYVCPYTDEESFTVTFELKATGEATGLMLASSSYDTYLNAFTLSTLIIGGDMEFTEEKPSAGSDYAQEDWYQEMLEKAQLNLGNNYRLKQMIEKAQNGEEITMAAIGGSITEGAGAARYKECYAYRTFEQFKEAYGAGDGSNVHFVNAGVGGTPSTFGIMRYERDIVERTDDADDLPDIVMVEYAVNDGGEPTNHGCYESLVKGILQQENNPVVILVFSVFPTGYTLQNELQKVGTNYDLMMVSTANGPFTYIGSRWTSKEFFYDVYHPTSLGHGVMADCIFHTIETAAAQETAANDIDLDVSPAYNTNYLGLKTIFKDSYDESIDLDMGSFTADDGGAYQNIPIGKVYAKNFQHISGSEPMTFTINSKNLLLAFRSVNNADYGSIEVYVDGVKKKTIKGNTGSWGQSVTELIFSETTAKEHKVEIRMAEGDEDKKFTITCMGYTE